MSAPLAALLSLVVLAGPPKPVSELAAAIDGARRSDGKKECTFAVEAPQCALAVRVSCATPLMKYSYVMTLPLGKLDPKKSVYQANAGGFPGAHGVELTASPGALIETVTDDGQKTSGEVVVLAFGTSADEEKRARKVVATVAAAKKACK